MPRIAVVVVGGLTAQVLVTVASVFIPTADDRYGAPLSVGQSCFGLPIARCGTTFDPLPFVVNIAITAAIWFGVTTLAVLSATYAGSSVGAPTASTNDLVSTLTPALFTLWVLVTSAVLRRYLGAPWALVGIGVFVAVIVGAIASGQSLGGTIPAVGIGLLFLWCVALVIIARRADRAVQRV